MTARWRSAGRVVAAVVALVVLGAAGIAWLNLRGEWDGGATALSPTATAVQVERGAYLVRAGNCAGCHTARGGPAFAGGVAIATPFGTVYASNLTPDRETGIGNWSAGDFWRAMHNGRSKDGRLLYPAFPYTSYTQVTRTDTDAIYAFLRSQPAVAQPNRPHALRFPYDSQAALAVWRALFFAPGVFEPTPGQSAEWSRGAYLVRGLGHCAACHSPRNALGATVATRELHGGLIPMQDWYAPSLASAGEAGVADWETRHVVDLLKTGVSARGTAIGPMADVVFRSTQYLDEADLRAMAVFLKSVPPADYARPPSSDAIPGGAARGAKLYADHCAACHGEQGQGAPGAYPALAGNRLVTMASPLNLLRIIMAGGFPPVTAGNPRPYGMPPFGHALGNAEIAALATYLRSAWGHAAPPVSERAVLAAR